MLYWFRFQGEVCRSDAHRLPGTEPNHYQRTMSSGPFEWNEVFFLHGPLYTYKHINLFINKYIILMGPPDLHNIPSATFHFHNPTGCRNSAVFLSPTPIQGNTLGGNILRRLHRWPRAYYGGDLSIERRLGKK